MLRQHGLEKTVAYRAAITAVSALLLTAGAFTIVPRDATHHDTVLPVATSVVSANPTPAQSGPSAPTATTSLEATAARTPQAPAPTTGPLINPLPEWVQSTTEIALWSTSDDAAKKLSTIPKDSYLKVDGRPVNGCLPVHLDGSDGEGAIGGWVNAGDVRSSSHPPRVVASSRGGSRSASPDISTPDRFISVVAQAAQTSQVSTGVPASVTIAQAILESEWGKSLLAKEAFNFFGIKAQSGPGPAGVVDMNTWEVMNGSDTVVDSAFKAYHNVFESVVDHGRFLRDNPRYSDAFQAERDPREFARRINAAGYATDPSYSSKLIGLMNKYNLYQFDLPLPQ